MRVKVVAHGDSVPPQEDRNEDKAERCYRRYSTPHPLCSSLGGLNVLVLYLQERLGWRAGKVQMVIDSLIVLGAFWVADWERVALSVLGAVVLNLTLAINHRPGRYMAM